MGVLLDIGSTKVGPVKAGHFALKVGEILESTEHPISGRMPEV